MSKVLNYDLNKFLCSKITLYFLCCFKFMIYNVFNLFREFKVVDQAVSKFGESSDQGYFLDVHNFAK